MSKPLSLWRRAKRNSVPYVGRFYEHLAASVLKARTISGSTDDLYLGKISAGIEVKASDNNHTPRVRIEQLERHSENAIGFPAPYDRFLYCMFCYKNRSTTKVNGNPRKSRLGSCKDEVEVYSMLAQNTDSLYVLDHRIIERMRNVFGVSKGKFPCQPDEQTVEIKRSLLKSFNLLNSTHILSSLGFEPVEWRIRERIVRVSVNIGLFCHQFELKVVDVLHTDIAKYFDVAVRVPVRNASRRSMRINPIRVAS